MTPQPARARLTPAFTRATTSRWRGRALAAALASLTVVSGCQRDGGGLRSDSLVALASVDHSRPDIANRELSDAEIGAAISAINLLGVRLGLMVTNRAEDEMTRSLAQRAVDEHRALTQRVSASMKRIGLVPQAGPIVEDIALTATELAFRLDGKQGAELDAAYLDTVIKIYEESLRLLVRAASRPRLPAIDSTIADARRTLEARLDDAWRVRDARGAQLLTSMNPSPAVSAAHQSP